VILLVMIVIVTTSYFSSFDSPLMRTMADDEDSGEDEGVPLNAPALTEGTSVSSASTLP
jgi:hypothetical protein